MTPQVPAGTHRDLTGRTAHAGMRTRKGTHTTRWLPWGTCRGRGWEGAEGAAPLRSLYLLGKGERGSRGGAHGQLPRWELPGRLVGEVNRLAGDHAEEQGEERGQPGLGRQDRQTDRCTETDRGRRLLESSRKLRAQEGMERPGLHLLPGRSGGLGQGRAGATLASETPGS